ncbi:DUF1707 domain-containing protein [Mycolicibacterium sp.]|uniref:DUF1707 SHOCT-like domain-containing protein n=1 Tax=Mycolicibacterium sp. TaxID=2320850 RepID=UPI0028ADCDAA|nr:DUF1707 domain-containing protein [Mycolicibacterium sp.]
MSRKSTPSTEASDDDRIQVSQLLSEAAANGRLTLEQYEARLSRTYAATSYAQLERITSDLPEALEYRRRKSRPAPSTMLLAILSGFERRGRWNIPGRMTTFTLFGGGVVDLRYADFTSPNVQIHAYSIFGGQTILLPPEVNVDIKGHGVMGGFDHVVDGSGTPGAPTVTIKGFSLWGDVDIKRRKRRAHATYLP